MTLPVLDVAPTRGEDLDYVIAAEQHPDNLAMLLPWSRDEHLASLGDPVLCHLMARHASEPVGFAILAGLDNPHRSLELRRIVVTDKGRGFGRVLMRHVVALAFDALGAHRLWLDTQTGNVRAQALYGDEGFVPEGVLRECWLQDGSYQSLVVMSILEAEYRARTPAVC